MSRRILFCKAYLDGIKTNGWDYYNNKYPNYTYQTFCLRLQDPWGDYSKIEVIGNIFDNPELLEENNMKYKVSYIGFAYVEADSEEEAKKKSDVDDIIYAEHE